MPVHRCFAYTVALPVGATLLRDFPNASLGLEPRSPDPFGPGCSPVTSLAFGNWRKVRESNSQPPKEHSLSKRARCAVSADFPCFGEVGGSRTLTPFGTRLSFWLGYHLQHNLVKIGAVGEIRTLTPEGTGTSSQRVYRSTTTAKHWRKVRESNSQSPKGHSFSKRARCAVSADLPLCLSKLVRLGGIEPPRLSALPSDDSVSTVPPQPRDPGARVGARTRCFFSTSSVFKERCDLVGSWTARPRKRRTPPPG